MLELPQVTLCCVDTRLPGLALEAMQRCLDQVRFGAALLFTRTDHGLAQLPEGLQVLPADAIRSTADYSRFLLSDLADHVSGSHVLIVQWDGFILEPAAWREEFLACDYIGAVWPQYKDTHNVGNGGFSLRSRRLIEAFRAGGYAVGHPEDECLARQHRARLEAEHGIRFASPELARAFSYERERPGAATFGFHGLSNLPDAWPAERMERFIREAPGELFASLEARGLVKRLLALGRKPAARAAFQRRRERRGASLSDLRLWLRLIA